MLDLALVLLLHPTAPAGPSLRVPVVQEAPVDHERADRDSLRDLKDLLRAKEAAQRIQGLERAAALTRDHPEAPTKAVAAALVEGLEDEVVEVREKALVLLLDGQHPDATVEGLVDALQGGERELARMQRQLEEMVENVRSGKMGLVSQEDSARFLRTPEFFRRLAEALGHIPDPRCEEALAKASKASLDDWCGPVFAELGEALARQATARSTKAAVELRNRLDDALRRGRIDRRFPRTGRMVDVWTIQLREPTEADLEAIEAALRASASTLALPAPPAPGTRDSDWKTWLRANEGSFTAERSRLKEPVRVELEPPPKKG